MRHFRIVAILATLQLLAASPALATWSHDPFLGNNLVASCPATIAQLRMAPDGIGGTFFAWTDFRNSPTDIYVQRLDAHGNATWGAGGMAAVDTVGNQEDPAIVPDGNGGMILFWSDPIDPSTDRDIWAMGIDASGTTTWTTTVCTATDVQRYLVATSDGAGGAIVALGGSQGGQ